MECEFNGGGGRGREAAAGDWNDEEGWERWRSMDLRAPDELELSNSTDS